MKKIYMILLNILVIVSVAFSQGGSVSLNLISTLPSTITNINLSHYDIKGTGKGPTMFVINLKNDSDNKVKDLKIEYKTELSSVAAGNRLVTISNGYSNSFDLDSMENVSVTSGNFLQKNNPAVKFSRKVTTSTIRDDELENSILRTGKVPTGELKYTITVISNLGEILNSETITAKIINVNAVRPLSPGSASGRNISEIYNEYPMFIWSSDLTNNMYGSGQYVFEINVYEKKINSTEVEALSSIPILSKKVSTLSYQFPPLGPKRLESGKTYIWQVKARLVGVIDAEILSIPYVFKIASRSNPNIARIKSALKDIAEVSGKKNIISVIEGYDKDVSININGKESEYLDLLNLINSLLDKKYKIISITIK